MGDVDLHTVAAQWVVSDVVVLRLLAGGRFGLARAALARTATSSAERCDYASQAEALSARGELNLWRGLTTEATDDLFQALDLAQGEGAIRVECVTALRVATLHRYQGAFRAASTSNRKSLGLAESLSDDRLYARALHQAARLQQDQRDLETAFNTYLDVQRHFRALRDASGTALSMKDIGRVITDQGDYAEAQGWLQEAVRLARRSGDRVTLGACLHSLGRLYQESLDQPGDAQQLFSEAVRLRRETEDLRGEAATLNHLGRILDDNQNHQAAQECLRRALAVRRGLGDRRGQAATLANLGHHYGLLAVRASRESSIPQSSTHDLTDACVRCFEQAARVWAEIGDTPALLDIQRGLSSAIHAPWAQRAGLSQAFAAGHDRLARLPNHQ